MSRLRKKLRFKKLKEVVKDAESLLETGYRQGGDWSLGEICDHLAKSMARFYGRPFGAIPGVMQYGFFVVAQAAAGATRGRQVPTLIPPKKRISDEEGVRRLTKAIKKLKKSAKRPTNRYLFGKAAYRRSREFQLWHCAHHLSFLAKKKKAS